MYFLWQSCEIHKSAILQKQKQKTSPLRTYIDFKWKKLNVVKVNILQQNIVVLKS